MQAKHLSKGVTVGTEEGKSQADNDKVKKQKLLINPGLREIVNLFYPEITNK
jgi:hypothetical protein